MAGLPGDKKVSNVTGTCMKAILHEVLCTVKDVTLWAAGGDRQKEEKETKRRRRRRTMKKRRKEISTLSGIKGREAEGGGCGED